MPTRDAPPIGHIEFLNRIQTLRQAIDKGMSITRFGDGEMALVFPRIWDKIQGIPFQRWSSQLRTSLERVFLEPAPNLLVCLNLEFACLDKYPVVMDYERSSKAYSRYLSVHKHNDVGMLSRNKEQKKTLQKTNKLQELAPIQLYGEATCFMLCFFYEEYLNNCISETLDLYKSMLAFKRVLFVCPRKPLMGPSFEHLCSTEVIRSPKSVDVLFVPERHCFEYYDDIVHRILTYKMIDLVLVQAGPAATVIVADLSRDHGRTAYDVGSWNVSLEKANLIHGVSF